MWYFILNSHNQSNVIVSSLYNNYTKYYMAHNTYFNPLFGWLICDLLVRLHQTEPYIHTQIMISFCVLIHIFYSIRTSTSYIQNKNHTKGYYIKGGGTETRICFQCVTYNFFIIFFFQGNEKLLTFNSLFKADAKLSWICIVVLLCLWKWVENCTFNRKPKYKFLQEKIR